MKILLIAVDSKFIHTNLAVQSLKAYCGEHKENIHLAHFTINNTKEEILRGIYKERADVAAFSCYIWNISLILQIIENLKKVQPHIKIWLGGPEVSYNPKEYLIKYKEIDGIVIGEGEQTFYELVRYYLGLEEEPANIKGIAFKESAKLKATGDNSDCEVIITDPREPMNLDNIPFPYEDINDLKNKIIYYESSRGCPYSCSYCLSSAQKGVRFRNMNLVKKELKIFLDNQVPQVKFVDRTFNCNRKRAMEIWNFIKENDNGITNFHFEITADLFSEEELKLLETLRPGLVQFEIGVQTTNPETMKAINRMVDFEKLAGNVNYLREKRNIHQHLDLIAGLPLEDYKSFEKSFNDVYRLKPDQLQLGFLKVLKGSLIEKDCEKYGIECCNFPPYEVLFTDHITYDEILELKGISHMVDMYYNSGQFSYTMEFMAHYFDSPMKMYLSLYRYYDKKGLYTLEHSRMKRYEILLEFFADIVNVNDKLTDEETGVFKEILVYDYCLREGLKNRPYFAGQPVEYQKFKRICLEHNIDKAKAHIEYFNYDILESVKTGKGVKKKCLILFDYSKRDPITRSAQTSIITEK
ncbi:MAG TPA: B12-binding domain-containing radical SAM protein [Mobilitalea sp.]|nr:B12-binding domain-containing radical SAM protein [Mobilitalea sp.]